MSVAKLERTMGMGELRDWRLFFQHEQPSPDMLFDIHLARIATLMIALTGTTDGKVPVVEDFLIIGDRKPMPPEPASVSEIDRLRAEWRGG